MSCVDFRYVFVLMIVLELNNKPVSVSGVGARDPQRSDAGDAQNLLDAGTSSHHHLQHPLPCGDSTIQ